MNQDCPHPTSSVENPFTRLAEKALQIMNDQTSNVLLENGPVSLIQPQTKDQEYIVVSDNQSEVLLSTHNRYEAQKFAGKIRRAGGSVTVFKALEI